MVTGALMLLLGPATIVSMPGLHLLADSAVLLARSVRRLKSLPPSALCTAWLTVSLVSATSSSPR